MKAFRSLQQVNRQPGLDSRYGWLIEEGASTRSVHPFESAEARQEFVAAVARLVAEEPNVKSAGPNAERVAAALTLRAHGDSKADRAWGEDLLKQLAGHLAHHRLGQLRDLAERWCPRAGRAAQEWNAAALAHTLGMEALGRPWGPGCEVRR